MIVKVTEKEWLRAFVARHQVTLYFVVTFAISWTGALAVAAQQYYEGIHCPR